MQGLKDRPGWADCRKEEKVLVTEVGEGGEDQYEMSGQREAGTSSYLHSFLLCVIKITEGF